MDSVDIVRLEYWNVDSVHWVHGQCPLNPWTMSYESVDIVHWVHGQYPLSPWTMSTETMDNIHSVHGHFPWVFPILYLVKNYSNPTKLNAYIQFTIHVIYNAYMSINTDRHTVSRSSAVRQNKLHCFIYCAVVSQCITFYKITSNFMV